MTARQKVDGTPKRLAFTRRIVSFGPRPAGSEAIRKLQTHILGELKPLGCQVIQDDFTGSTPLGQTPMRNIIAHFPGKSGKIVVITGHYDTKSMPGTYFVGANDGGSSAGFLLEMAKVLAHMPHQDDVWLVWFDGEEGGGAVVGLRQSLRQPAILPVGGRRMAQLGRIRALINVDMIGDRDLGILGKDYEFRGAVARDLVWQIAERLGLRQAFFAKPEVPSTMTTIPFLKREGKRAMDLIDLDYGPGNSYWHTDKDTMDKLSAASFEIVGRVVGTLKELERENGADGRDHRRR